MGGFLTPVNLFGSSLGLQTRLLENRRVLQYGLEPDKKKYSKSNQWTKYNQCNDSTSVFRYLQ